MKTALGSNLVSRIEKLRKETLGIIRGAIQNIGSSKEFEEFIEVIEANGFTLEEVASDLLEVNVTANVIDQLWSKCDRDRIVTLSYNARVSDDNNTNLIRLAEYLFELQVGLEVFRSHSLLWEAVLLEPKLHSIKNLLLVQGAESNSILDCTRELICPDEVDVESIHIIF